MYKLYYLPGACSLATQTIIHELGLPVEIVNKTQAPEFAELNPVGTVPVLIDNGEVLREGAAVMLHLLESNRSAMLPADGPQRRRAIQSIMFANATMHPAYSRLFFLTQNMEDSPARSAALQAAADNISKLWQVVDNQVGDKPFLDSDQLSAADVMLTVYSRWGQYFPVNITLGANSERMIANVSNRPSFQRALAAEQAQSEAA